MSELLYTLIWIAVMLLFIGFFAGMEIAFVSANRLNIELRKKQGRSSARIISGFMEKPAGFMGTSLLGFNLCLVLYGLLFSSLLESFWNPLAIENYYVQLVFNTVVSSAVVLVFGEFIPKAIFRAKADVLLPFFAGIFNLFHNILYPLASIFVSISEGVLKYLFNVRVRENNEPFSKTDLEHFFQQTKESDEDGQELNTELFENALSLPAVKIRQCLVPRTEIEYIMLNAPVAELKQRFVDTNLSKIVVCNGNIDEIVGYVHQLDMLKRPANLQSILHPIPAVPESMSATDLITLFSKDRKSIAWVVDEFGGTSGIVTMEDVLEKIFGEIKDEYDVEEFVEKQLSENEYIFSGRLELDYLNERYSFDFPEEENDTLSGHIINYHEAIPRLKERIIIGDYEFDVLSVSDTRIEMVKMKVLRYKD